jgi:glycosyltransferase involved in cell wall biosynthesis
MNDRTLEHLYHDHGGKVSDKWALYISEYDRLFCQLRNREINILEIGVQNGGSLEIWARYFEKAKNLIGCDIDPNCHSLTFADTRIAVVVGDANADETENAILSKAPVYDLIIDDGSHRSSDVIRSFLRYFPHVSDGGLFVVEDLHCSYWKEFEGGLFAPFSAMTFFKRLVDILNHEHWGVVRTRNGMLDGFAAEYGVSVNDNFLSEVHAVEFINSLCVVRKSKTPNNHIGHRIISGIERLEHSESDETPRPLIVLDQSTNVYSLRSSPPEEEIATLDPYIDAMTKELSVLHARVLRLEREAATFGAKIGRTLTQLRVAVAPGGSRRGKMVDVLLKVVALTRSSGLKDAALAAYRHAFLRLRRKLFHGPTISDATNPELAAWIAEHEPNRDQLASQREKIQRFKYTPLLSVIIPIYRVPREVLSTTLNSLVQQTYSNWQACIVWADSQDSRGWQWLQETTATDKRFKIKRLDSNGGISKNTNAALELVEGEYVALLDHDDALAPWAFYEAIQLLQSSRELDFIYSDKDAITGDGRIRLNALFKPEWSPEMMHSVNYLTHLNILRTSLVRETGGWRPETDGAQDWDLFFRITEKTQHIARIPSILYHWRVLPTSTATGLQTKPYAVKGQLLAQQNHFRRKGLPAVVLSTPEGLFHVRWHVKARSVDVIVCQTGSQKQLANILGLLWKGQHDVIRRVYAVQSAHMSAGPELFHHPWDDRLVFVPCDVVNWRSGLATVARGNHDQTIVLIDGTVSDLSDDLVEELAGWVEQHPEIAWTSAVALNSEGIVYEAGRVVAQNYQSAPMFHGSRFNSTGWFGGPFWYRNARAASPYGVAAKAGNIRAALSALDDTETERSGFSRFCMTLSSTGRRGLINPFAKVYFDQSPETHWPNEGRLYRKDPYFNPAFNQVSPLKLQ